MARRADLVPFRITGKDFICVCAGKGTPGGTDRELEVGAGAVEYKARCAARGA
jgi:hypothetical protein